MIPVVSRQIRAAAAGALLVLVAAFLVVLGAGFLIAAAYMALAAATNPVSAALLIGACCVSLALVLLAFAKQRRARPDTSLHAQLVEALVSGFRAGRRAGKRRD